MTITIASTLITIAIEIATFNGGLGVKTKTIPTNSTMTIRRIFVAIPIPTARPVQNLPWPVTGVPKTINVMPREVGTVVYLATAARIIIPVTTKPIIPVTRTLTVLTAHFLPPSVTFVPLTTSVMPLVASMDVPMV